MITESHERKIDTCTLLGMINKMADNPIVFPSCRSKFCPNISNNLQVLLQTSGAAGSSYGEVRMLMPFYDLGSTVIILWRTAFIVSYFSTSDTLPFTSENVFSQQDYLSVLVDSDLCQNKDRDVFIMDNIFLYTFIETRAVPD